MGARWAKVPLALPSEVAELDPSGGAAFMRFVCGPIPYSQAFDPAAKGWTPLDGADAKRFATIACVLAIPFVAAALWLFLGFRSDARFFLREHPFHFGAFLSLLAALIPLHELIHAFAYFKGVRSSRLMMGAWLSRGMFYAIYDAPLPRHRVLIMSMMPFLMLSVLPAVCLPWLGLRHESLVMAWILVLLHTSLCTGDFLVWWQLCCHVPRGAWIHNNGWTTYWTNRG